MDCEVTRVGLRAVRVHQGQFLVNDVPVEIRGLFYFFLSKCVRVCVYVCVYIILVILYGAVKHLTDLCVCVCVCVYVYVCVCVCVCVCVYTYAYICTYIGVNRHEHDERTGKYTDFASMKLDIECMKQLNINAVRCSHYPNRNLWYAMCDAYGLYLCDEVCILSYLVHTCCCKHG